MNLVLLHDADFIARDVVRLTGRRYEHITRVQRVVAGDTLVAGVENGRVGEGTIVRVDGDAIEMRVVLDRDPPAALPLALIVALPRPKVLNRVIAGATSMGVKRRDELLAPRSHRRRIGEIVGRMSTFPPNPSAGA